MESRHLFEAIREGDLQRLRHQIDGMPEDELGKLMSTRLRHTLLLRRPSNGREVYIRNPTPVMVAVVEWYADVLDYLSSFGVGLDEECTVEDNTNSPPVYDGVTPLHIACLSGKLTMVQSLITNGANVNRQTSLGDTALFEACFEGHLSIVQYLVDNRGNLELYNNRNVTCLMIAAYADNVETIQYLIGGEVNVNKTDDHGRNALFYCTSSGHLDTMVYLMDNGAEPCHDYQGINLLMDAAFQGHRDIVQYLVQFSYQLGTDVTDVDNSGRNALFYCCEGNRPDVFDFLFDAGVPIAPANDGRTLLMVATLKGHTSFVNHLLTNAERLNIDVNEKDNKGRNCLFYCITGSDVVMFELLLDHGALIEPSSEGITLLMQAVAKHQIEFTEYLLDNAGLYGINVNDQDNDGWNALFYCVASGHVDIFNMLISNGARQRRAKDGRTILMQAATKGNMEFVRYMVDNADALSIDIDQKDNDGWSTLYYCVQADRIDILRFLFKRGAKCDVIKNGSNLLMEAIDKGRSEIVSYIVENLDMMQLDINQRDHAGSNALFYCAAVGDLKMFKLLLKSGCNLDADGNGRNVLMQAVLSRQTAITQYLVLNDDKIGIDVHHCDDDGRNAIFYCVDGGSMQLLEYLIGFGVQLLPDKDNKTNLMQAAAAGKTDFVEYILDNREKLNVDVNHVDDKGENALFYAVRSHRVASVRALLKHGVEIRTNVEGVNVLAQAMADGRHRSVEAMLNSQTDISHAVNGKDENGRTFLSHCVNNGISKWLWKLASFFDPTTDFDRDGLTLLMRACYQSNPKLLHFLVNDLKVDLKVLDNEHRNALFHSVEANNFQAFKLLFERTATIEDDDNSRTILMLAAEKGNVKMVEYMMESNYRNSLLSKKDADGNSVMHYAAKKGLVNILNLFYLNGCDLNDCNTDKTTPLMLSCATGNDKATWYLLDKGAYVHLEDSHKRNALYHCYTFVRPLKCMTMLINYNIDINAREEKGMTPLIVACDVCRRGQIDVIRCLLENGADPVMLDNDGKDAFDHCSFEKDNFRSAMLAYTDMDEIDQCILSEVRQRLVTEINLKLLLPRMIATGLMTKALNFDVMKNAGQQLRIDALLQVLYKRGPRSFRLFCDALKKDHHELAFELMRASYIAHKQNEIYI